MSGDEVRTIVVKKGVCGDCGVGKEGGRVARLDKESRISMYSAF